MEFKEMTIEQLEERKAAIATEIEAEDADLEALEAEIRGINDELEERKAAEAKKAELRAAVAQGEGEVIKKPVVVEERKTMTVEEIRNSKAYIDAYAEYIKSGDDTECRALLTEDATAATGYVPVPTIVYDIVKTAWETEGIMSRVRKAYMKGNLKVGFELSATDAEIHAEGDSAPSEETLTMGIVTLTPQSIKKWITVSDEAIDLAGEALLDYVYREVAYRIAKKAADTLVTKIIACGTTAASTAVGVPVITSTTIGVGLIAEALGKLSDEAANPVIMMNKSTWATFKAAEYAGNFDVDPFEGLEVVFNNSITAFSAATTGVTYAIVGDLSEGALANFPNGEEITLKFDDLSLAEKDLVKIVGREYVGLGVVGDRAFVKIIH